MPHKKPEDYIPSPWTRDLKEEVSAERLHMPLAMVGALYQLQKDKQEVEYGGAVDFELVKGKPAVERVLAYTGAVKAVPVEVWDKVFLNPDVELTFHTHPRQKLAIPSEGDIIFFLTTAAQAMLIVAGQESILLTKGSGTPPPDYSRRYMGETKAFLRSIGVTPIAYYAPTAKQNQEEMIKDLKEILDISCTVFPATEPIEITVKIVQEVAKEGKRLEIFKG